MVTRPTAAAYIVNARSNRSIGDAKPRLSREFAAALAENYVRDLVSNCEAIASLFDDSKHGVVYLSSSCSAGALPTSSTATELDSPTSRTDAIVRSVTSTPATSATSPKERHLTGEQSPPPGPIVPRRQAEYSPKPGPEPETTPHPLAIELTHCQLRTLSPADAAAGRPFPISQRIKDPAQGGVFADKLRTTDSLEDLEKTLAEVKEELFSFEMMVELMRKARAADVDELFKADARVDVGTVDFHSLDPQSVDLRSDEDDLAKSEACSSLSPRRAYLLGSGRFVEPSGSLSSVPSTEACLISGPFSRRCSHESVDSSVAVQSTVTLEPRSRPGSKTLPILTQEGSEPLQRVDATAAVQQLSSSAVPLATVRVLSPSIVVPEVRLPQADCDAPSRSPPRKVICSPRAGLSGCSSPQPSMLSPPCAGCSTPGIGQAPRVLSAASAPVPQHPVQVLRPPPVVSLSLSSPRPRCSAIGPASPRSDRSLPRGSSGSGAVAVGQSPALPRSPRCLLAAPNTMAMPGPPRNSVAQAVHTPPQVCPPAFSAQAAVSSSCIVQPGTCSPPLTARSRAASPVTMACNLVQSTAVQPAPAHHNLSPLTLHRLQQSSARQISYTEIHAPGDGRSVERKPHRSSSSIPVATNLGSSGSLTPGRPPQQILIRPNVRAKSSGNFNRPGPTTKQPRLPCAASARLPSAASPRLPSAAERKGGSAAPSPQSKDSRPGTPLNYRRGARRESSNGADENRVCRGVSRSASQEGTSVASTPGMPSAFQVALQDIQAVSMPSLPAPATSQASGQEVQNSAMAPSTSTARHLGLIDLVPNVIDLVETCGTH